MQRRGAPWAGRVGAALLLAAVFAGGFLMRNATGQPAPDFWRRVPPVDHFLWWESFSEVEQTRSLLDALCRHAIAEVRAKYLDNRMMPAPTTEASVRSAERSLANAIEEMDRRIEEFAGTEQRLVLQLERLRLLRRSGKEDAWLDGFLELFYQRPTNPLVLSLVDQALLSAKSLHREAELQAALENHHRIPHELRPNLREVFP